MRRATHRDADHRRRAGRACPPATTSSGAAARSSSWTATQRIGDNWRQQWDTLAPVHAGEVRRASGTAVPGSALALPAEGRGRRLPGTLRAALRPAGTDQHPGRTAWRRGRTAGTSRTSASEAISCDNVVVATGTFGRTPNVPEFAGELDPSIRQLHSSQYRRPAQLQPGPVLVVGASHSGQDIAYELAETRPTILCGPDRGNIPFRPESRRAHVLMPVVMFAFKHVLTRRTPMGRKEMQEVRFHGGPPSGSSGTTWTAAAWSATRPG